VVALDEPVHAEDHLALRYFGKRAVEAVRDLKSVKVTFRADLSRPQLRRDFLDGVLGLDCCAGSYRQYPTSSSDAARRSGSTGGVPIGGSGEAGRAWIFQCFLDGRRRRGPLARAGHPEGLGEGRGHGAPPAAESGMEKRAYATLRLKALRRGQQDVELLHLLLQKMKASREEVRGGIAQALGLLGDFKKTSEVDAGRTRLRPAGFRQIRSAPPGAPEALDK
jgi:hypothetical protein